MSFLKNVDPEIYTVIEQDTNRQESTIDLIASENYASKAVMQATGSPLTNKYAEGYPGKRYYGGCEFVDVAENLARDRCKKLFGADHVNVQPHAGSPANMAVYFVALNIGDTVLGMSLAEGGHLTHGHKVNFSGTFYKSVQYTVDKETEMLDYNQIQMLAEQHKPKLIIAGASAYSRTIDFKKFADIAKSVGALFLADIAHIAGLVATGLHESPIPYADFVTSTTHKTLRGPRGGLIMCKQEFAHKIDKAIMPGLQGGPFMNVIAAKAVAFHEALQPTFKAYQEQVLKNAKIMAQTFQELGYRIVTGGTDNHLFIIDLRSKGINGKIGEAALDAVGISVSRSAVPFDTESVFVTSGLRIGTPAITTRGMQEAQAQEIVHLMDEAIVKRNDKKMVSIIKDKVALLCSKFQIYCFLALILLVYPVQSMEGNKSGNYWTNEKGSELLLINAKTNLDKGIESQNLIMISFAATQLKSINPKNDKTYYQLGRSYFEKANITQNNLFYLYSSYYLSCIKELQSPTFEDFYTKTANKALEYETFRINKFNELTEPTQYEKLINNPYMPEAAKFYTIAYQLAKSYLEEINDPLPWDSSSKPEESNCVPIIMMFAIAEKDPVLKKYIDAFKLL